ncbi:MAG: DUF1877 family protein [Hyphomonadaceae bacterium]
MSMICSALAIDGATLEQLRNDDDLISGATDLAYKRLLDEQIERMMASRPEAERVAARRRRQQAEAAMLARLPENLAAEISKARASRDRASTLDLRSATSMEKSWDAFHHLFELAGGSLFEGEPFGPNRGYGPAFLRMPENVVAFAAFLSGPGAHQVKNADMNWLREQRLYAWPDAGDTSVSDDELRQGLDTHFAVFNGYVQAAAQRGDALLIWIS